MPPIEIIATPGDVDANSYATLEAADDYHAGHLYADAWDDASDDRKNRALVMATRMLDTWFDWIGEVASIEQALLWPRRSVLRPNRTIPGASDIWPWHSLQSGLLESSAAVPTRIVEATAELARSLLVADRTADSDVETQGLRSLTAGPVRLDFAASVLAKPLPDMVVAMVSPYGRLRMRSGSGTVTLLRA